MSIEPMRMADSHRLPLLVLFFCIAAQAALTLCYAITLHYELKTSGLDGTVYEQLMHNVLAGHGFSSSMNPPYMPQPWLGFHFSPILFFIVPFYYFFPHIETLLALGSFCVALAAWPIYLTAKAILQNSGQALLIALVYLINPFVVNGIVWDFHEIDFAPLVIGWMLWAVVHQKRAALLALSAVLLCIKEHYGLSIAGFGMLWAWQWRRSKADIKFGLCLAAFGIAMAVLIIGVVVPHFNPHGKPPMMNTNSSQDRFGWLTSIDSIKANAALIITEGLWYSIKLLLPLMMLPLAACMWLLPAMADAAANLLSRESMMRAIISYHTIAVIPVLLIASCQAIRRYFRRRSNDVLLAIAVASFCFSYLVLALPFSAIGNVWEFSGIRLSYTQQDRAALQAINSIIPKDAVIAAQNNILPHLDLRYEMYQFPTMPAHVEYIVLNLSFPFKRAMAIMGMPYGNNSGYYFSHVDEILHDKEWGVVYYSNRWVLLQKGGTDNPQAHQAAVAALDMLRQEFWEVHETIRKSFSKH